ncbi:acid phosphatase 1 [Carica papaya]|uniref:acid phosphatase 1 n=1 Tax=Carica papaya TaxID=3649 RepID=UPI000B8CB182|nr:acid phosphatase 1 [Carica papaya]
MDSHLHSLLSIIPLLLFLISLASAKSIIQMPTSSDDSLCCDSWRLSAETNNAGYWTNIPSRCIQFVQDYMTGARYLSDFHVVSEFSLDFARSVEIGTDGKDAWIFDIDETLLSNLPYYELHGFGSETFNETSFYEWVDLAEAPALQHSLELYKELKQMGFKIILLTGRTEYHRNATAKNLVYAGFNDWERLILRGLTDEGKEATVFKSERRLDLINESYRIHGNSGDQWSDLLGYAVASRSFKLPNPMYYVL